MTSALDNFISFSLRFITFFDPFSVDYVVLLVQSTRFVFFRFSLQNSSTYDRLLEVTWYTVQRHVPRTVIIPVLFFDFYPISSRASRFMENLNADKPPE